MIKRTRTKTSQVGTSQVKSSKPELQGVFDIFSDSNSTEDAKTFDNPQHERGYTHSAKTPDLSSPTPKSQPASNNNSYRSPNFNLHNDVLTQNSTKTPNFSLGLDKKAYEPLAVTDTRSTNISNLSSTKMSNHILEKYPSANHIAQSNASYPTDFKSNMNPIKNSFKVDSFNQIQEVRSNTQQKIAEIPFNKTSILKDGNEVKQIINSKADITKMPSSDLSQLNVFSKDALPKDYSSGQFQQNSQASSIMTKNSITAGETASPQRAVNALSIPEGKNSFKGSKINPITSNIDMSIKNKITSPGKPISSKNDSLNSKNFFVSNFNSIHSSITNNITSSSSNI